MLKMKNRFGQIAENYQKKYGVDKKAIYRGICSGATFTRVETEERNLDYLVIETGLADVPFAIPRETADYLRSLLA